jgi:hypothetical protein
MTYSSQYGTAVYGYSQYAQAGSYWDLQFYNATQWESIKRDCIGQVVTQHGFSGNEITDRVAGPGSIQFTLNNAHNNSGGIQGYYTPGGPNCRVGFDLGSMFRFMVSDGTTIKYQVRSKAVSITPTAGIHGDQRVEVTTADYINDMALAPLQQIPVQVNTYINLALQTVLGYMPVAPKHTSGIAAPNGPESYNRLLSGMADNKSSMITAAQRLTQTDKSYFFFIGDDDEGETAKWQSRNDRTTAVVAASFVNTMCNLLVERDGTKLYNDITTVANPSAVDAAAVILAKTDAREFQIPALSSVTMTIQFTDPLQLGRRVDMIDGSQPVGWPLSGTDFKMSSVAGDNANNLSANFSVAVTWGANSAKCVFSNSNAGIGYVSLFHIQGKGIYYYTPVEKENTDTLANLQLYGKRSLRYDMPYCDSESQANIFGAAILVDKKSPVSNISEVSFYAHDPNNPAFAGYAASLDIGDCIFLGETVTGLGGHYYIQNIKWEGGVGNSLKVTMSNPERASIFLPFIMEPAEESTPPGDAAWSIMMRYEEGDPSYTATDPYGHPWHVMFP